ncbi:MAG: hypothetical protein LBC20_06395 [Planctomycetaceae bacterium]|jgi:hypothetical protein|nr:hypothetical protein [Planctomycetaceae bacterium]
MKNSRKFHWVGYLTWFILLIFLIAQSFILANNKESQFTKFESFKELDSVKQRLLLKQVFEQYLTFSHNLSYKIEVISEFRKYSSDSAGELIESPTRKTFSYKVFQNKFKLDIEYFSSDNKITEISSVFYDRDEGEGRSVSQLAGQLENNYFGRIDTIQNPIVVGNDYQHWLNDTFHDETLNPFVDKNSYLFPWLLNNQDQWQITLLHEQRSIQIHVPYKPNFELDTIDGMRKLILDPEKGFMPIEGESRWNGSFKNGIKIYREEKFEVKESNLIDNVWMPLVLIESTHSSSAPEQICVSKIKIIEIEHGQLIDEDMAFKFPKDTRVTDAIKGIFYKTDVNGEPVESTIQPLYGLDPSQVKLPEPPKRKINVVFIVTGILLIVTALYIHFKKRRTLN